MDIFRPHENGFIVPHAERRCQPFPARFFDSKDKKIEKNDQKQISSGDASKWAKMEKILTQRGKAARLCKLVTVVFVGSA